MTWEIVFTKQAQKDAKKLAEAGLKDKASELLEVIRENPFHSPPRFEKLVGDLSGAYSRRITSAPTGLRSSGTSKNHQNHPHVDPF